MELHLSWSPGARLSTQFCERQALMSSSSQFCGQDQWRQVGLCSLTHAIPRFETSASSPVPNVLSEMCLLNPFCSLRSLVCPTPPPVLLHDASFVSVLQVSLLVFPGTVFGSVSEFCLLCSGTAFSLLPAASHVLVRSFFFFFCAVVFSPLPQLS